MEPHFTAACEEPYDQCVYLLVTEDGNVDSVWDNYEHVRDHWMVYHGRTKQQKMKTIIPVTVEEWEAGQKKPKTKGGGFG